MNFIHFKNYRPSDEEKIMFQDVQVLSDGFMSENEEQFEKAKKYFTDKGAFGKKWKDARHEELYSQYEFFKSLQKSASAEGRDSAVFSMIEKARKVREQAKLEGYEL